MPVILTSSIKGTYTLGVRSTLYQTDIDATFSRSRDQGKIIKKDWKIIMDVCMIFRA